MYQHQDGKNVKRTEAEFPSAARVADPQWDRAHAREIWHPRLSSEDSYRHCDCRGPQACLAPVKVLY